MTDDELIEELYQASRAGHTIRKEWLEEFIWHPDGQERLRELGRGADEPLLLALMDLLHEYADASRRNASKKRRKTTEPGVSWQRELAGHLHAEVDGSKREKYLHIPLENDAEPLSLCDGKFEITRSGNVNRKGSEGPFLRCAFDDGRPPAEISLTTFESYLKKPSGKRKRGG